MNNRDVTRGKNLQTTLKFISNCQVSAQELTVFRALLQLGQHHCGNRHTTKLLVELCQRLQRVQSDHIFVNIGMEQVLQHLQRVLKISRSCYCRTARSCMKSSLTVDSDRKSS